MVIQQLLGISTAYGQNPSLQQCFHLMQTGTKSDLTLLRPNFSIYCSGIRNKYDSVVAMSDVAVILSLISTKAVSISCDSGYRIKYQSVW